MSPAPKPAALRDSKLQLQSPQRALLSPNPKLSFRAEQAGNFSSLSLLREAGLRSREISLRSPGFSVDSSPRASLLARRQQKCDEIFQIFVRKSFRVIRWH